MKEPRPAVLRGETTCMETGCGPLYVTINEDSNGRMIELFTTMGKAGGCAAAQVEAIGRLVSVSMRSGADPADLMKQLSGISCHSPAGFGDNKILSCGDAIARVMRDYIARKNEQKVETITLVKAA